eukprot:gene10822-2901_t
MNQKEDEDSSTAVTIQQKTKQSRTAVLPEIFMDDINDKRMRALDLLPQSKVPGHQ